MCVSTVQYSTDGAPHLIGRHRLPKRLPPKSKFQGNNKAPTFPDLHHVSGTKAKQVDKKCVGKR